MAKSGFDKFTLQPKYIEVGREIGMSSSGPVSKSNVLAVPLPTALPDPVQLDHLPTSVLHSATVEALLGQIDDLTARLKVNLRRNSLLEMDLRKAKENLEYFKERNQSLELKSLVDKEKEASAEQRFQRLSERIKELEGQISIYELRLSKSVNEAQSLEDQRQKLEARTQRFNGLRARVKSRLRNYLNKQTELLREENIQLTAELEDQRSAVGRLTTQVAELKNLLESSAERLQEKEREMRALRQSMEEEYQGQISSLQSSLLSAEAQLKVQLDKVSTLQADLVGAEELHNEVVHLRDRLKSQREYYELEIAELQKSVRTYRLEAKSLSLEKIKLEDRLKDLEDSLRIQKEYTSKLEDQLESAHLILYPDTPESEEDHRAPENTL
jgi:chromosome segregation ATPase